MEDIFTGTYGDCSGKMRGIALNFRGVTSHMKTTHLLTILTKKTYTKKNYKKYLIFFRTSAIIRWYLKYIL